MSGAVERVKGFGPIRYVLAVQARFGEDGAGLLGSAIAFQAFISLFPLILVGLSVIGFVLAGRPDLQAEWRDSIATSIPGLRSLVGDNFDAIVDARAGTGLVGLAGLAWTGTGLVRVSRAAVHRIMHIEDPSNAATGLLRALRTFGITGVLALVTLGAGAWAGNAPATGWSGLALRGAATLVSLLVDVVFFLVAFWLLSRPKGPPVRDLVRGAVLVGVAWTILKIAGSWYARRTVAGAIAVYGSFAASIGLLVMLALVAKAFVYGAVVNALAADADLRTAERASPDASEAVRRG